MKNTKTDEMDVAKLELWELAWLERQCRISGDIEWANKFNEEYKRRSKPKSLANYVSKNVYDGKRPLTPKQLERAKETIRVSNAAKKKVAKKKASKKTR